MAEIIKVVKEHLPNLRFIGKRYTESDRVNGSFAHLWDEWFNKAWFEPLAKSGITPGVENGCIGFMRTCPQNEYWIGAFLPPKTDVPEGYDFVDMAESDVGVCWIKGKADDVGIYTMHEKCIEELKQNGMGKLPGDDAGGPYFFERYNVPRYTEQDDDGYIILDYGVYLA